MLEGTSTATFLLYHEPEVHRGRGVLCRKPQGRLYFPRNEKKKLTQAWSSVPSFLLSFTQYKGGPFPQGSKHMEDPSRTIHSSLSDLYLPLAPLHTREEGSFPARPLALCLEFPPEECGTKLQEGEDAAASGKAVGLCMWKQSLLVGISGSEKECFFSVAFSHLPAINSCILSLTLL